MCRNRPTDWESRYAAVDRLWSGQPNAWLVSAATGWQPGTSLDVGCGEGEDVLWLAAQGWQATGVDLSRTAVDRLLNQARSRGLAGRVQGQARDGAFEPQLVKKRQRRLSDMDAIALSLFAKG